MATVRGMAVPVRSGSGSYRFAGKPVQAVHTQILEIPKTAKTPKHKFAQNHAHRVDLAERFRLVLSRGLYDQI